MNFKRIVTYHEASHLALFEAQLKIIQGKNVLVTFDDGDASFYENAFPLLIKYNIPTILFVITGLIDSMKPFWWDEINHHLGSDKGPTRIAQLKKVSDKERLEVLNEIRLKSDRKELITRQLTRSELEEMHKEGIIIANHSHTHPMMDQLDQAGVLEELNESREFFKGLGFGHFDWFAYPNGNYSEEVESILKEYGIQYAFLFDHHLNKGSNVLRISRLSVNDDTPVWKYKLILSGLHSRLVPISKGLNKILK